MGVLDISSAQAPLVGIVFTALSMLPIGMTQAGAAAGARRPLRWR